jgi:hypothetical protein
MNQRNLGSLRVFLMLFSSGLDSFMALGVMQCLKDLAKKSNMTVICAIHQPRSQIWKLFDKILLLSEGQTVYYGPCGDQVVEHFAALGHCCPDHYNPPDFLLDLIAVDYRTEETEKSTRARVEELLAAPHLSVLPESLEAEVQQADHFTQKIKTASALKQSAVVAKRSLLEKARDFTFLLRFVEATILSVLLGIIYFQLPLDQAGTQSRSGLLFFSVVYAVRSFPRLVLTSLGFWNLTSYYSFDSQREAYLQERECSELLWSYCLLSRKELC